MISNMSLSIMLERTRELCDGTPDNQIFMHRHLVILSASPPKQSKLVIGIDAGMAHPGTIKEILSRNFIRNRITRLPTINLRDHFSLERQRHALVGIDNEDPF